MTTPLKESAVVILRLKGTDKILFLMRREGWCLPGGKLDDGETIEHCAYRELLEETGIKVPITPGAYKYLGQEVSVNGRVVHVFYAETNQIKVKLSNEHSDKKWVSINKIPKLALAGNTGKFINLYKV